MRTLNDNSGAAANWTTSALSIVSTRSGMRALLTGSGSRFEMREERANFTPDFGAAGKSAPMHADQPDELVTFVDRNEIVLRGCGASDMPDAVDKQCHHVFLHFCQNRISLHKVSPGVQAEQRLRGPRRAGVQSDDLV